MEENFLLFYAQNSNIAWECLSTSWCVYRSTDDWKLQEKKKKKEYFFEEIDAMGFMSDHKKILEMQIMNFVASKILTVNNN